jgi:predicted dehydrogenase
VGGDQPVTIGILGAARIVPMALIRPARQVPEVRIEAIAARDEGRARSFAAKHHIARTHPTYDALLSDPDIEAIYNPLPNGLHCQWTVRALAAGKHVLCEKPIASNADEASRMEAAAADNGRTLMEAFHYRYHPLADRLRAIITSGDLGTIRHIETHFCIPLISPGNIRYDYELAGGATMDVGCYAISLLRFLAGAEPEVITATARLARPKVDRWMAADFRFPDGRTGHMTCALMSAVLFRARAIVQGDSGTLSVLNPYLPHLFHLVTVRTRAGVRRERIRGDATYAHQLRAFAAAIRSDVPIPTDAANGIANMNVIDAVYSAAGLPRRG